MGLDMYLYVKKYTSKYQDVEKNDRVWSLFPEIERIDNLDTAEVYFEYGYWRKANHIHNWFVENCQEGVDECQRTNISREDLRKLLKICKEVNKHKEKAEDLLPCAEGFFFGDDDYDEYYFGDVENTIKVIEKCLRLPEDWEFEYHSSW